MPPDILNTCRSYFAESYRTKLGLELSTAVSTVATGRAPVWRLVSRDDLTTERMPPATDAAGLLLDPEIGVLCYVLLFDGEKITQQQIRRALALRSQLTLEHRYSTDTPGATDSRGAWRIAMHWIVGSARARQQWTELIINVRRKTAFSEELSLDVIEANGDAVLKKVDAHGFPRLLLTTRQVLRQSRAEEIAQWMSANDLVKQALLSFPSHFRAPGERQCAEEVTRAAEEFIAKPRKSAATPDGIHGPREFRALRIRNFRNFSDFALDCGNERVGTRVVHGPNGTGKSTLCEALSIALFGSSPRYLRFADTLREPDVTARNRAQEYVDKYLKPAQSTNGMPEIALDNATFAPVRLVPSADARAADVAMAGTILTQDATLEFARMAAEELGSRVLQGYSDLAQHVEDVADKIVQRVNSERQEFLRGLSISAAITKIETAYERIAKREIEQILPKIDHATLEWFQEAQSIARDRMHGILDKWRTWDDDDSRQELYRDLARHHSQAERVKGTLADWLRERNDLIALSSAVVMDVKSHLGFGSDDVARLVQQASAWGEWLERRESRDSIASSRESQDLELRLNQLRIQQQQILDRGKSARARLDHLRQVEGYMRAWSVQHPSECPTCGADHGTAGGILAVFQRSMSEASDERAALQKQYEDLTAEIQRSQAALAARGAEACPVSDQEQASLRELLQWIAPSGSDFQNWLRVAHNRESMRRALTTLAREPRLPRAIDLQPDGDRMAARIVGQWQNAERIFQAPDDWRPVRERLTSILASIVNEHLPSTLTRLWCELVLNLTAAPWLLLDRPQIAITTRRTEQKASLQVKDRLARYILNESEIHVLGVGWFLTQYLTRGRFSNSCIVMDDPAHELDQTSFRELCRLLETIVRLHRVYEYPLKLVLTFHQESRALDAARATGGILVVLDWERSQDGPARSVTVLPEGYLAPQPAPLFEVERTS